MSVKNYKSQALTHTCLDKSVQDFSDEVKIKDDQKKSSN